MDLVLERVGKAEAALNAKYFSGWLQAMNNPEQFRARGALIRECFEQIRGELTNAD